MKPGKSYSYHLFGRLGLLLLYASFFLVQLFYNFDITPHAATAMLHATAASKEVHVSKAGHSSDKKTAIRLNKRYQPQSPVLLQNIIIRQQVCYVSSKLHVHYCAGFVPLPATPIHTLRGPPAVV